jgi:hypothetical protein
MKELIAHRHTGVFSDVEELILKRLITVILHCTFVVGARCWWCNG